MTKMGGMNEICSRCGLTQARFHDSDWRCLQALGEEVENIRESLRLAELVVGDVMRRLQRLEGGR